MACKVRETGETKEARETGEALEAEEAWEAKVNNR